MTATPQNTEPEQMAYSYRKNFGQWWVYTTLGGETDEVIAVCVNERAAKVIVAALNREEIGTAALRSAEAAPPEEDLFDLVHRVHAAMRRGGWKAFHAHGLGIEYSDAHGPLIGDFPAPETAKPCGEAASAEPSKESSPNPPAVSPKGEPTKGESPRPMKLKAEKNGSNLVIWAPKEGGREAYVGTICSSSLTPARAEEIAFRINHFEAGGGGVQGQGGEKA
jgi:hypothetical protein